MTPEEKAQAGIREVYQQTMQSISSAFAAEMRTAAAGSRAIAARAQEVDRIVAEVWTAAQKRDPRLAAGTALVAVGGYGRRELFPYSDVDLLFLLDGRLDEKDLKDSIRSVHQELWDCGLRVSAMTRKLAECERFDPENVEFTLSLLDARLITGDAEVYGRLAEKLLPKLLARDRKKIVGRLLEVTRARHAKYGDTLFHLEPNIKECPGGLRDVHVCGWLEQLQEDGGAGSKAAGSAGDEEFAESREFLCTTRWFLHMRHERDDNVLDWLAQDAAAAQSLGLGGAGAQVHDAGYWMRFYFRHARSVERRVTKVMEEAEGLQAPVRRARLPLLEKIGFGGSGSKASKAVESRGFQLRQGWIALDAGLPGGDDPAHDPEIVLDMFGAMSRSGARLSRASELRVEQALPLLSAHLEDGPALRRRLAVILTGPFAGRALRTMHALGTLELLIPEFHGIDALVIRDAYHRYTVDEHTFVVIDTLHSLHAAPVVEGQPGQMAEWAGRFGTILRDLPHPELLYLAALLHDTGKGRSSDDHPRESQRMAEGVLARLELDSYESGLVLGTIRNHLEMSAALRRDVFDKETVQAFAGKVQTPEALRMLALFTYADIWAVHPDALTPWKAENLWRLYVSTSNYLDRSVDDERVGASAESELVHRVAALLPGRREAVWSFLEGFPERYIRTRTPEQVKTHFQMAERLAGGPTNTVELDFRYAAGVSEITLVTGDREMLFAGMAGALAAWGMNIVTADAFSNRQGLVVDSFRFTDSFRTLEMNDSERARLVDSVRDVMLGKVSMEKVLAGRRRGRRRAVKVAVEARVDFDDAASSHSTLLQVVAQDTPGLLHALSRTIGEQGCNIEVALVDTEGEMAIDVFYVTRLHRKLDAAEQGSLREALLAAMEQNVR
ncbi:[protein-PII] uridylyltransferase [Granulicella sp. WH15]|uniref:[protein-PII] uridylyltransferase n=1 Tax=Granulicella sp. WH15 TaxID=2602070 RepID=UPI0013670D97|nr:[protein-PII] uridylyltransferase [Granulicella sp. WH15]QHN02825.1 [protein-PII] uridylyltransferase [Granulicella sp. WH15]